MLRVALAQVNAHVGDVGGNTDRVLDAWCEAAEAGADLVVFPELVIGGYPPEDLLLKSSFVTANERAIQRLAEEGPHGAVAVIGFVSQREDVDRDRERDTPVPARQFLRNCAAVLAEGRVVDVYYKGRLPTYGLFDEARWFTPGTKTVLCNIRDVPVGVVLCEDLWTEQGPVTDVAQRGARVIAVPNASPYNRGKHHEREDWVRHHAQQDQVWVAYANLVGGQDGIVFYGDSVVCSPDGTALAHAAQFDEDLVLVDVDVDAEPLEFAPNLGGHQGERRTLPDREENPRYSSTAEVWEALVVGTRDYLHKNGFQKAVVGLSGGIDSSTTACIAVDALGPRNVLALIMPSPFTSEESRRDAEEVAKNLEIQVEVIAINDLMEGFEASLGDLFEGLERDETEENIQARIRGVLLMAVSNKFGHIVLAPGNKSEFAAGYATLYGDMVGGFAPLMDVHKMLVYELAQHRNEREQVIPENVLKKKATAELARDQSDRDTLPPYEVFDPIMCLYVEEYKTVEEIVAEGHDPETVRDVVERIDRAEYKRRQAPPGVKITDHAFGKDRHIPMTNAWRG